MLTAPAEVSFFEDAESRLKLIVEQLPAQAWATDLEMRIQWSIGRVIRVDPRAILGKTIPELIEKYRANPAAIEGHRRALAGEICRYEGGGEGIVLECHLQPFRDPRGRIIGVVGVALDITERKRAEETLQNAQRRLLDAEALGGTGSWEMDPASGKVISSEENRRLFFGDDQSRGASFHEYFELFHPEDVERMHRAWKFLEAGGEKTDTEYRIIRPDGSLRVLFGRTRAVRDEAGNLVRTFGTNADITERKRIEEQLAWRAQQQSALAKIGLSALSGGEIEELFEQAAGLVKSVLGVESCAVMESMAREGVLLSRAGAWKNGPVSAAAGSMGWYVMQSAAPVVACDLPAEKRFVPWPLLLEQGIVSCAAVAIPGEGQPFGLLGAYARSRRAWSPDDLGFLQATAALLGSTIERQRAAFELRTKREQLQALSRRLIRAQEDERRAVSRELHDDFGQVLTAIKLNLERAGATSPLVSESIVLVDEALRRMRDLACGLRPPMLDELGLAPALRWYVGREAQRAGLQVRLSVAELELSPELATTCFRLVQEALTNVTRHAQARRVELDLAQIDGDVRLVIRDDGVGFDVTTARRRAVTGQSQGLLSMQERVSLAGGELQIESATAQGTAVRAWFPRGA